MVIDRSSTSENVYMMSLVDENDLAEFLDENRGNQDRRKNQKVVIPETNHRTRTYRGQPETEVNPESGGNKMWGSASCGGRIVLVFGGSVLLL